MAQAETNSVHSKKLVVFMASAFSKGCATP
jgi:hypothetical protein